MSFKVVLADTTAADYEVEQEVFLESDLDLDVRYLQTRIPSEFGPAVADADAVVLSWAPFTRDVIAGLTRCRVIVRYGIGVDMIDLEAATDHGILVCNTARYCIDEVSTHTIALLLMLNRQLRPHLDAVRNGGWSPRNVLPPRRLRGQRLGLIGSGNIGLAAASKARGLGLETVAYDPFLQERNAQIPNVPLLPLDDVLSTSDYVSIHCPLNSSTFHSIGARELNLMKPSAFLINCARGAIVDQAALVAALTEKRIAGAGLDVVEIEPLPAEDPIRQFDNVIITPHAAHWSVESSIECRRTAIEHVLTFLDGQIPADVVNRAVLERGLRAWGPENG